MYNSPKSQMTILLKKVPSGCLGQVLFSVGQITLLPKSDPLPKSWQAGNGSSRGLLDRVKHGGGSLPTGCHSSHEGLSRTLKKA